MNYSLNALGPYALVIISGLFAHACFQLSVSTLTLLGSHVIGSGKSHAILLKLSIGYACGVLFATACLLALLTYFFTTALPIHQSPVAWIIVCALVVVVGWLVLVLYYRRGKGTRLWLPRRITEAVGIQAKRIKRTVGAFGLGSAMVIAELPFLIAPLTLAGAVLAGLAELERSIGVLAYSLAATTPLVIIIILIGGGHKISTIQRWREANKKFLQWTSGLTLILLGIYLFAITIWGKPA